MWSRRCLVCKRGTVSLASSAVPCCWERSDGGHAVYSVDMRVVRTESSWPRGTTPPGVSAWEGWRVMRGPRGRFSGGRIAGLGHPGAPRNMPVNRCPGVALTYQPGQERRGRQEGQVGFRQLGGRRTVVCLWLCDWGYPCPALVIIPLMYTTRGQDQLSPTFPLP